jgi:homeodomain-containing protein
MIPSESIRDYQTECTMHKKHIVRLSDEERTQWTELTNKGKAAAYKIRHAHILLQADADGPAWTDERIAESFSVSVNTVRGVRQRLVEQGLEAALTRKKQDHPSRTPRLDGAGEARLIALRCSTPPAGHARWTLRLLAD